VKDGFFKFPSTPHIALLGDIDVRGDKVMSDLDRDKFLQHELVVEEKIDGANVGISFDADGNVCAQNRGSYLYRPGSGQWKPLGKWLDFKADVLFEHLYDRFILFGEWCYAQHSVSYDSLPDWFLGFDVYDKRTSRFVSYGRRDILCQRMGVCQVPMIARGHFTLADLEITLASSKFSCHAAEGIYLRYDQGDWLVQRGKLVRPTFMQTIEQHWSHSGVRPNMLRR
jgi:ATP-dependent RNA circularization protein (DNA/RNA ligase family)